MPGRLLNAAEYNHLYMTMVIDQTKISEINYLIDQHIVVNKEKYERIRKRLYGFKPEDKTPKIPSGMFDYNPFQQSNQMQKHKSIFDYPVPYSVDQSKIGIPWYAIALIHYLECDFSFNKHLFNGDSLKGYTQREPAGYPKLGHKPPFTFEESAIAALKLEHFDRIFNWNLPKILRCLEKYNGFGYEINHNIASPYLWSGSNHYTKGKYVKDRVFVADAVSKQIGTAVIIKQMEKRGIITIQYF